MRAMETKPAASLNVGEEFALVGCARGGDHLAIALMSSDVPLNARSIKTLDQLAVEGAIFENPTAPETIGLDLVLSDRSQSLTKESEAGKEPIKPDRAR